MKIEDFLAQPSAWLAEDPKSGIVISSRIRLARNIRDKRFPGWAIESERESIWTELSAILMEIKPMESALSASMTELSKLDKHVLFERHLISREHAEKGVGSGLVVKRDESVAVMVNEEDHLRLQALCPGLKLTTAWEAVNAVDNVLEDQVSYSFSTQLGYLTACPSNVGTGMRASVMLHLPGLVLMDEINPIVKGMSKIGLAVRGLWGEGTEATGNMFQISNQITLGEKEEDIIANLEQIVLELVEHEKNARVRLMDERDIVLQDHVGRACGILSHAHILTSKEALDLLSGLRLGIELGILKHLDRSLANELLILTQPGHLQKMKGKRLKASDRDKARADIVREKFLNAEKISNGKSKTKNRNS